MMPEDNGGRPGKPASRLKALPRPPSIDPDEMLRVNAEVSPHTPPAVMPAVRDLRSGTLSMRCTNHALNVLAAEAIRTGKTQKVLVFEALKAAGLDIPPEDLVNRPPTRRGG